MRLVLVRHGETDHNRGRLTLGRADVPLNDLGRRQAQALAAAFARPPDAIVASPLARTADTAAAIAAACGLAVRPAPALIEMDVGEMEHLTPEELRDRYPDFLRQWLSGDPSDARMPGGETLREVQDRAWAAVEGLAAEFQENTIVAVTHNFVILTLACRALGMPLANFRRLQVGLAARSVLEVGAARTAVLALNDTAHLLAAGLADDLYGKEART
jgi:broad specificity phosphatase PhoE